MKVNRKEYFFTFLAFCLVIAFLEIGLAFAAFMSPSINQLLLRPGRSSRVIEDNRLGHRPNPKFPGHDSKGFRNLSVPKEAKIVALVDTLPSLREQLVIGIQPYNESRGGHPNKHGHKSIARLVYQTIQR